MNSGCRSIQAIACSKDSMRDAQELGRERFDAEIGERDRGIAVRREECGRVVRKTASGTTDHDDRRERPVALREEDVGDQTRFADAYAHAGGDRAARLVAAMVSPSTSAVISKRVWVEPLTEEAAALGAAVRRQRPDHTGRAWRQEAAGIRRGAIEIDPTGRIGNVMRRGGPIRIAGDTGSDFDALTGCHTAQSDVDRFINETVARLDVERGGEMIGLGHAALQNERDGATLRHSDRERATTTAHPAELDDEFSNYKILKSRHEKWWCVTVS